MTSQAKRPGSGGLTDQEFSQAKALVLCQEPMKKQPTQLHKLSSIAKLDDGNQDRSRSLLAWTMALLTFFGLLAWLSQNTERPLGFVLAILTAKVIFFITGVRYWRSAEIKKGAILMAQSKERVQKNSTARPFPVTPKLILTRLP